MGVKLTLKVDFLEIYMLIKILVYILQQRVRRLMPKDIVYCLLDCLLSILQQF